MASLSRVRVGWSGVAVTGPGVSTFYTSGDGGDLQAGLHTFFTAIQTCFPNLKGAWEFPAGGEIIESTTGALTGAWSGATPSSVPWAAPNALWMQGVGARIRWDTDGFLRGRRVRGATFLVPLNSSMIDSDGTILGAYLTTITTAANALITAVPQMSIWSRPTTVGGTDGGSTPVTSAFVPDHVSWLVSRRT